MAIALVLQQLQESGAAHLLSLSAVWAGRLLKAALVHTRRLVHAVRGALTVFVLLLVIAMLSPAAASRVHNGRSFERLHKGVGLAARIVHARPEDVYAAQHALMSGMALGGSTALSAADARELSASIGVTPACEGTPVSARAENKRCTTLNLLDSGAGV